MIIASNDDQHTTAATAAIKSTQAKARRSSTEKITMPITEAHLKALKRVEGSLDQFHSDPQTSTNGKDGIEDSAAAFREALKVNPKLVAMETPADEFLRTSNGSAIEAAQRLCRYWNLRYKHFSGTSKASGDDRDDYLRRPLTILSGRGALRAADDEVFKSGFFVNLPPAKDGRPVVFLDRSLLQRDFDNLDLLLPSILRCAFYVLSIAATATNNQNNSSNDYQYHGLVLLVARHFEEESPGVPSSSSTSPFDEKMLKGIYEVVKVMFPRKVATEVVTLTPKAGFRGPFHAANFIERLCENTFPSESDNASFMVTMDDCKREMMHKLLKRGLKSAASIPNSLGGTWKYFSAFGSWRRARVVTEELLEAAAANDLTEARRSEIIAKEAAKKRKRDHDIVYAQRKRQKNKLLKQSLREQIHGLREQKETLLKESEELSSKLLVAKRIAAGVEATKNAANLHAFRRFGPSAGAVLPPLLKPAPLHQSVIQMNQGLPALQQQQHQRIAPSLSSISHFQPRVDPSAVASVNNRKLLDRLKIVAAIRRATAPAPLSALTAAPTFTPPALMAQQHLASLPIAASAMNQIDAEILKMLRFKQKLSLAQVAPHVVGGVAANPLLSNLAPYY